MANATKSDLQLWKDELQAQMDKSDADAKGDRKEIRDDIKGLTRGINAVKVHEERERGKIWAELGKLYVKSGVWGAAAGLIPIVIALIFLYLKG